MKRTKTFTGCWTCRDRKVKCDETKPQCRYCLVRGYDCGGYGVRLHWLTPQLDPNADDPTPGDCSPRGLQRRRLPVEPLVDVLGGDEIERILRTIDSFELSSNDDASSFSSEASSLTLANFGVFYAGTTSVPQHGSPINAEECSTVNEAIEQEDNLHQLQLSGKRWVANEQGAAGDGGSDSLTRAASNLWHLYVHQSTTERDALSPQTPLCSPATPGSEDVLTRLETVSHCTPKSLTLYSPPSAGGSIPPGKDFFFIPLEERYLLRYYIEKVVQLSCVVDNDKSPWKTIHLPRALQGVGQLSIEGSTSGIRHALRNDLLSISAFQLSNHHRFLDRQDEASKWFRAASQYRCNAIGLLKQAMEKDLYSQSRPKYKDFLATMISMVSINVMSGDTSSCGVHLDGAGQLITHMGSFKQTYSPKATALHRIYYYVRLIYESTVMDGPSFNARYPMPTGQDDLSGCQNSLNITERDDTIKPSASWEKARMSTYEYVYGISRDVLMFLRRCIATVELVDNARAAKEGGGIPYELEHQIDELERDILDYDCEDHLRQLNLLDGSVSSRIIMLQSRAFHNAVIVYFSQNVRLLNHRYLRQYTEAIIEHIEEIEQIKADTSTLAAPLYWPAFIGASEAYDAQLQDRYRHWYDRVEMYGIEAVRTGIRVLDEVWRMGAVPKRRTSAWRMVIQRTGDVLMLT
ncbi:fungal-specific transcription factor domain-containing protein [Stachybotrys elegans]|uniref:Fungal-specific transcription factor domain-containing protein n=1 Tax=Stachybotrys elegans TaxID=80388 RepID=A0A8K0SZS9_9HYPO|nr:fungal-specific transcription factor domain-containing protein [Stachybotrys elegans]